LDNIRQARKKGNDIGARFEQMKGEHASFKGKAPTAVELGPGGNGGDEQQ